MGTITSWWIAFIIIFIVVYAIDLSIHMRKHSTESVSVALKWAALWITIALLFAAAIYLFFPQNPDSDLITSHIMGVKFLSGYLTEYSLSVDNLFVFIMIFSMMGISEENQPKLLMLGILISVVLRVLFILIGMGLYSL
jgi:tellurite resistance protein TerC